MSKSDAKRGTLSVKKWCQGVLTKRQYVTSWEGEHVGSVRCKCVSSLTCTLALQYLSKKKLNYRDVRGALHGGQRPR